MATYTYYLVWSPTAGYWQGIGKGWSTDKESAWTATSSEKAKRVCSLIKNRISDAVAIKK